jgi:hypothetical protein
MEIILLKCLALGSCIALCCVTVWTWDLAHAVNLVAQI